MNGLHSFFASLFDGRFESADAVFWAAVGLGVACGVLGPFVLLRRQSLLGDAIGHAVLPGVAIGYLAVGSRNPFALLVGAMIAGLLAAVLIALLQRTDRLKSGECMGVVFSGFYGLGVLLLKLIERQPTGGKAGLGKFLLGQIAGIGNGEVLAVGIVAALAVVAVMLFWRPLKLTSFDEGFARTIGLRVDAIGYLLTILLTAVIVVAIQAVGVVLVAALLVTPAAAAFLLTDRLGPMVLLSVGIATLSGIGGAIGGISSQHLPTGALIVLCASSLFALAWTFGPVHGRVPAWWRVRSRRRTTAAQDLLRTMWVMREKSERDDELFAVIDVAAARRDPPEIVLAAAKLAARRGWISVENQWLRFTPAGLSEASRLVRNHRLWELFLTRHASLAADHVHNEAERIEHVLPPTIVAELSRLLDEPRVDPHGKLIPRAAL